MVRTFNEACCLRAVNVSFTQKLTCVNIWLFLELVISEKPACLFVHNISLVFSGPYLKYKYFTNIPPRKKYTICSALPWTLLKVGEFNL